MKHKNTQDTKMKIRRKKKENMKFTSKELKRKMTLAVDQEVFTAIPRIVHTFNFFGTPGNSNRLGLEDH